jgi:energy-coupling factor transporter ATP-binding protein EcfA2
MQLESMWVHGLRRFGGEKPTRLRIDAPLVCVVGANEVGKSTLLDALEMAPGEVNDDNKWIPVDPTEWSRGEKLDSNREIIRLRYRLSAEEKKQLRSLESGKQLRDVRWLEQILRVGGVSFLWLDPAPKRDLGPRRKLAHTLRGVLDDDDWPSQDEAHASPDAVEAVVEVLESDDENITASLDDLQAVANAMEEDGWSEALIKNMKYMYELEDRPTPQAEGRKALKDLVPRFVRFEMPERQLADEYDLVTAANNPPPALHNLAELAGLNLVELLDQIQAGLTGSVRKTLDDANDVLREVFSAWKQRPPVVVSFDWSGTSLLIHVQSGSGVPMKPRERSEGLRQFVGLVALTAGEGHQVPPILLIDEAEMHLHYDAQADLMDTLAKQTTAGQVIYTTHSSACLPEDLGSSIRVVRGVGDKMRSEIDQQFWSDDVGLVPLLLAMGAASMAFAPLRPAVVAEGGSELVLLPSLIKEAARITRLGYQVVPGAAEAPPQRIAGLDLHGVSTVWVLDGDQGGIDRRKYLSRQGVPKDRIHLLMEGSNGLDLEGLVHPETYVRAVNNYAEDLGAKEKFQVEQLPSKACGRHKATVAWCESQGLKAPGKTSIANKILDLRGREPLCHPDRQALIRALHQTLRKQLKVR